MNQFIQQYLSYTFAIDVPNATATFYKYWPDAWYFQRPGAALTCAALDRLMYADVDEAIDEAINSFPRYISDTLSIYLFTSISIYLGLTRMYIYVCIIYIYIYIYTVCI